MNKPNNQDNSLAIVGDGATLAVAIEKIKEYAHACNLKLISIFSPNPTLGAGYAYSASNLKDYILNENVSIMDLSTQEPSFYNWLSNNQQAIAYDFADFSEMKPDTYFAPRAVYGRYLHDRTHTNLDYLQTTFNIDCHILPYTVKRIDWDPQKELFEIHSNDHNLFYFTKVFLCTGGFQLKNTYSKLQLLPDDCYIDDHIKQSYKILNIPPQEPITIIGTGLSCYDCLMLIKRQGMPNTINCVSRTGRMPVIKPLLNMELPDNLAVDRLKSATNQVQLSDVIAAINKDLQKNLPAINRNTFPNNFNQLDQLTLHPDMADYAQQLNFQIQCINQNQFNNYVPLYFYMRRLWLLMDVLMENCQVDTQTHRSLRDYIEPIIMCFRAPLPLITGQIIQNLMDNNQVTFYFGIASYSVEQSNTHTQAHFFDQNKALLSSSKYVINTTGGNNIIEDFQAIEYLKNLYQAGLIRPFKQDNIQLGGLDFDPQTGRLIDQDGQANKNIFAGGQLLKGRQFNSNGVPLLKRLLDNTIKTLID